ncbi:DNA primase [Candidatus Woesebacteria bacterium GWC2_33_12]|uniref:DNA primase n=1 Tax=Candidatus Woesebacteria bacterium GW2011_GWB1_33_22 TaxID=1618566 RepID=A0A0F9ZIH0_9BACT|nr:MAG: primase protein [Candidatus Woesebacteria bacterium GW2011_GWC2_33_12]KKP41545.1 MAG: primase protein [Candidatus Woesebacteria bacterium GW2011_GWA2_33_20]KKP43998.1 MAG: primase protein [Candidatus Woesebacteria bacterium GW2011_GWB1_33_22]KKP46561.1 MAG: primase protein [Microgenomates group bacterium GW2011_GWC1_33_28]KKP49476.1 MAG: primase protein [Candidatus Woesebacteria bacterium GW2011_GWA1_33_33]OGM07694.1 MAG: DNA primase [Candidatus Woesebacteria bacterium GWC2_33_12]OGM8
MSDNQIEEVKSKTDIVSLLSEYLELKKAGRNYKANCPFHGEKTPSFMISPELQMYKCFGCGKSGDVFTFLEEHEGMEFGEALKYLADKAGVKLTTFKTEITSEREKIIEVNKSALNFYEYVLNSHPQGKRILEYLTKDRRLKPETIKLFKIGYSPESFNAFSDFLTKKKKFSLNDLKLTGLLVGRGIDRFRGRVIFPLMDHRDNVIGFAGRILPWVRQDMAKYINSPDTPAYHKSKVLYGLNITKSYIRDAKFAVIVEGEIDMISSFQAGIKNVIAIKGSALTEDQVRLIGRFAKKIILCLDSDFAGDEAAKRGAILAENLGFEVRVAHLEGYKDPDEIARKDPEKFKKAINDAIPIWDFLINTAVSKYGIETGEDKKKISQEVIPVLVSIEDKIVQAHYIEILARKLSVPVEAVFGQIEKNPSASLRTSEDVAIYGQAKTRRQLLEEKLLVNAISQKSKLIFKKETKELVSSEFILKVINNFEKNKNLPEELKEGYGEMVLANSESEDIDKIIFELTKLKLKQDLEDLGEKIKLDENNKELLTEFGEISKKLSTL